MKSIRLLSDISSQNRFHLKVLIACKDQNKIENEFRIVHEWQTYHALKILLINEEIMPKI